MKLVTFNIRCDYEQDGENSFCYRKPYILKKIRKESPDIICFQEVLPHVAMWLKKNLTDYYVIGCGRDENLEGEQTAIAYQKCRYNLMGMEVFWLSGTPKVVASRYEDQSTCPRTCTAALFQDVKTKESFRVFNTHLDHEGAGARKSGLTQILEKISKEKSFVPAPALLVGDFNALPSSSEMKVLEDYGEIVDFTAGIPGTFHDYGRLKEGEKIDYILGERRFSCREASLWKDCHKGVYLSDHYPVCVEIELL